MSRGIATTFAEWRFLLLTLLICAFLLTAPLIAGNWPVQLVFEALLLATVLVTVSANPGWHKLRRVLVVLWLVSVAGTLLSIFSIRPDLWQWFRTVELLTLVPALAPGASCRLAPMSVAKSIAHRPCRMCWPTIVTCSDCRLPLA